MARSLTPTDVHQLLNLIVKEQTGQASLTQIDSSNFVSVGEKVLSYGTENTLNAISIVVGRLMVAYRPYDAQFKIMNAVSTGEYTHRLRKISYYAKEALPSGGFNTNLYTNQANGYDNNTNGGSSLKSMWEQCPAMPLEINFAGSSVWDDCITRYENQVQTAFRSEEEFARFIEGYVVEKGNDMESQKEAFARMTLLNFMGSLYDAEAVLSNGMAYNLTDEFNTQNGTTYTTAQLQTTYLTEFLEFFTAFVKELKLDFKNRSAKMHWAVDKVVGSDTYKILRHTPADRIRGIMNARFFTKAEAKVFPQIFNTQYLDGGQGYELISYWQNENSPMGIDVVPAIPDLDGTNSGAQKAGSAVTLECVLGVLYDVDALMIDFQFEYARTTPVEARKGYMNTWYGFSRNAIQDITEKACLLYMAD